ncbi:unnamed protein product [Closterium sp. Naga37s-1]|nr:unnamed protein product [Closterium sp. Naga37s-1]
MDPSNSAQNRAPTNTDPSTSTPAPTDAPHTGGVLPKTQESQILGPPSTTNANATAATVTPTDWWVYHIPSPSASYDADEDYGFGAVGSNGAALGEMEEETAEPESVPTTSTAGASRRSTAMNNPRWTPEEECEVLATFIDLDAEIRARTGRQGRSWYPLVQWELFDRDPAWRHDVSALKAKYNRLKETWRCLNDRIKRLGEGRVQNLPPSRPGVARHGTHVKLVRAYAVSVTSM